MNIASTFWFPPITSCARSMRFWIQVGCGLSGARDEILLTTTAQNLRKPGRYVARPPPTLNPA